MRNFIINCIAFATIILLLNLIGFVFIAEPVLYKGYILKNTELKKHRKFLLGDSHAKAVRQIDLNHVDICNFAYDSDSYSDIKLKLEYLNRKHLVDTVFISIDNHTLSKYREGWNNRNRAIQYGKYKSYIESYPTNYKDYLAYKYFFYYLPLFDTGNSKLFRKYISSKIKRNEPPNFDNFDFSSLSEKKRLRKSVERVNTQFPDNYKSEKLTNCLNDIIKYCKKNKIILIGIKFPLTNIYIEEMGKSNYKADSVFEANGINIFDYSNIFPDSLSFYRDQDHLNYKGSEQLIQTILTDLI